MPWVAFLVISGVSTLVLVVLLIALVRHLRLLAGSLSSFRREVSPIVGELRENAERARVQMEAASRAAAELQPDDRRGRA